MITLQQGGWRARIAREGAELRSLGRDGQELLWQAQPAVWDATAPWLFPFVGRLRGGGFRHADRWHAMPLHGFAARHPFEVLAQTEGAVCLRLCSDAHTRALYPFEFALELHYRLDAQGLAIGLAVHNQGRETLPFGLGAHPGFALDGPLEAWTLRFEQAEADTVWRLQPEPPPWGLRAAQPEPWLRHDPARLPLHPELFVRDALILDPLRSRWVALEHRERGEHLRVHLGGAPQLGLWSRPGAGFLCIEPWWGRDDALDAPERLGDKPQLVQLPAGGRFERRLRIDGART